MGKGRGFDWVKTCVQFLFGKVCISNPEINFLVNSASTYELYRGTESGFRKISSALAKINKNKNSDVFFGDESERDYARRLLEKARNCTFTHSSRMICPSLPFIIVKFDFVCAKKSYGCL